MLYKVKVGRDEYLGTAAEVVGWMSKAQGAPKGGTRAYMEGIAARIAEREGDVPVDVSTPLAFLASLRDAGLIRMEERPEPSDERRDPSEVLDEGVVTFGDGVDLDDLDDLDGPEEA